MGNPVLEGSLKDTKVNVPNENVPNENVTENQGPVSNTMIDIKERIEARVLKNRNDKKDGNYDAISSARPDIVERIQARVERNRENKKSNVNEEPPTSVSAVDSEKYVIKGVQTESCWV